MNKDVSFTHKVGMTIFNLKVEYLNRLIEFKEIYALNSCGVIILTLQTVESVIVILDEQGSTVADCFKMACMASYV